MDRPALSVAWPDHVGWTPPANLHNELEALADVARGEIDACRGSVSDPASPESRAAGAAITARLVDAGLPLGLAQDAVTAWYILARPGSVAHAVRTAAARPTA